ncbi:MAG: hypothetical protein UR94_C0029G0014 [Parcubacteria group bacterium GW2011_GWA2_36_10]|nr:MAG: hypothetical protein UR94_C0029G0014 [Parcubacteria group bacterium GW2011_GWA2_36_10]
MPTKQRSAVIILKEDEILLMRRNKFGEKYFTIPGGTIEPGEDPKETAIREIKEETNLDIVLDKLLCEIKDEYHHGYYFLAKSFSGKIKLGSPELARQATGNLYDLQWIKIKDLQKILLYPKSIKEKIIKTFL